MIAVFSLFLLAALLGSSLFQAILAPANALLAAGVLFYVYIHCADHGFTRVSLLLIALACILWAVACILQAYLESNAYNAIVDLGYRMIRVLEILSLATSFFAVFISQFSQRNRFQFALDALSITMLSALFLWIVFFRKSSQNLLILMKLDGTTLVSLALDLLLSIGVFSGLYRCALVIFLVTG